MKTVKFTAMKDGDRDDYAFLTEHEIDYAAKTGERLLDALVQLDEGLSGYKITRLGHSLQAATRAWRDGADTDWDRLRATARYRRHLRTLQSRRICSFDPKTLRARAVHLGGGKAR